MMPVREKFDPSWHRTRLAAHITLFGDRAKLEKLGEQ